MARFPRFFLGLACLLSAVGCSTVESVHPLSDAKTSIKDDRLVGQWIAFDPKKAANEPVAEPMDEERLTIRRAEGEGTWYEAINPKQDDDKLTMFVAEIGGRRFLSVQGKEEAPDPRRFAIVQYEFSAKDEFRIYLMDPNLTAEAIEQGKIEGTVKREDLQPDADPNQPQQVQRVTLAASSEKLRKFFATKEGQSLFHTAEPLLIMRRATK